MGNGSAALWFWSDDILIAWDRVYNWERYMIFEEPLNG